MRQVTHLSSALLRMDGESELCDVSELSSLADSLLRVKSNDGDGFCVLGSPDHLDY